ncbi:hypothetical protein WIW50_11410 [Flavobacteriaceae bacterium 3-367]
MYRFLVLLLFLSIMSNSHAQEVEFKRTSIRTGIGIGYNEGKREHGMGLIYSIGWQKSYGENNRLRLNPNMIIGGFLPIGITDTRDQFYRITSLGLNLHYDFLRHKMFSLVATAGGFINNSRGLLGTGGWPDENNNSSRYFNTLYFGGNISAGIRVSPKNRKLAYEIRPLNIQVGNDFFVLGYLMFGIDFKIKQ